MRFTPAVPIASMALLLPVLASAQPAAAVGRLPDPSLMVISIGTAGLPLAPTEATRAASARVPPAIRAAAARPAPLVPLYLSFAALQALDAFTTIRALDRGAVEANPVMSGIAGNPAALVATKVGVAVGTVWLTERLWRRNRAAAVAMMAALNGMYAAVVAHNWQAVR